MNIRDLEYLISVAELEHFGKAAQRCHVSQPTLSGQIKKLEEDLGMTIFERTNRKVMLTEAGKEIMNHAKAILKERDVIYEVAHNFRDPLSGKFRLGVFPTLSTYIFPKVVSQIRKNLPNLRLILVEEKTHLLIEKLKSGELDAALLALPVDDDFLVKYKIFEDEFFLAVPTHHELTQQKFIDQKKLKDKTLLLLEEGHCLRDQSLEVCQLHNINEEQDFKATGLETLRQMVKAGTGITFMPKIAIQKGEKGIEYIPFKKPVPKRSIGLVWRKTTSKEKVLKELMNILMDLFEKRF